MAISVDQLGSPIDVRHRFQPQRTQLLDTLAELDADTWARPTACVGWTVADLVAHVVGALLGRISGLRGETPGPAMRPGEALPQFIDRRNEAWVDGWRGLAPSLLLELLASFGPVHDRLWDERSLDSDSLGVSWAGVDPAPTWLDAGRELTEYWVHSHQIAEAIDGYRSAADDVDLALVLDVFVRGLPFTLEGLAIDEVRSVRLSAQPPGIAWTLERANDGGWRIGRGDDPPVDEHVVVDGDQLWRLWTRQPLPHHDSPGQADGAVSPVRAGIEAHLAIVHPDLTPPPDRAAAPRSP